MKTQLSIIFILIFALAAPAWGEFQYRIPDTGQTKCYDNEKEIPCPKPGEPFYGQDGNYTINPPSYTKLDENGRDLPDDAKKWVMVRDNNTGLVWEVKTDERWFGSIHDEDKKFNMHSTEKVFIKTMNEEQYGSYADWSMPTAQELSTILNMGQCGPAINKHFFPNTNYHKLGGNYWSSNYSVNSEYAIDIYFFNGIMNQNSSSTPRYVRAVRREHLRQSNTLVSNEDGTVTDRSTNLLWQQRKTEEMTWEQALKYCENLKIGKYGNWRLPTIHELRSLVNYNFFPAINTEIFEHVKFKDYRQYKAYWSSTTYIDNIQSAWYVDFNYGLSFPGDKVDSKHIFAVRDIQKKLTDHLVFSTPKPQTSPITNNPKDTTPPAITITSPQTTRGIIRRKTEKIRIKGAAIDDSGVYQVLVNGEKAGMTSETEFEALAKLKIGENKITVKATDTKNNTATETFTIQREAETPIAYTPPPKSTPAQQTIGLKNWYSKQYAVVIGIDAYEQSAIPQLRNAVNDAKSVAAMFKDKFGFKVTELYNAKATKRAIIRSVSNITKIAKPQDAFVFYFAGHGQGISPQGKDSKAQGYIIPYDADVTLQDAQVILYDDEAISLSRLHVYAQDIQAKHTALILDSCFSGLAMKRSVPQLPAMSADYYEDLLARKAINILTAGDDHPVSDGSGHSPFTQALLNALDRGNLDLHDRDGFGTFTQLAVYVKEKVEKATGRRQRPQFDNLSMDDGEFVFRMR